MAKAKMRVRSQSEYAKEYLDTFKELCRTHSSWEVWQDTITAMACTIANSTADRESEIFAKREQEYERCIERLDGNRDLVAKMFAAMIMALEMNPQQDFLGQMFMDLGLGNEWKGQFFTPYDVCELMAKLTVDGTKEEISKRGWHSVNDCACGAGATLIAMANVLKSQGINYQTQTLFVAQDVDRIAALMCYVQLSLLGCAGYVVVANTLTDPIQGNVLYPTQQEGQEFWFTPMYSTQVWQWRRIFNLLSEQTGVL